MPDSFVESQTQLTPSISMSNPLQHSSKRIWNADVNAGRMWRRDECLLDIATELEKFPEQYRCVSFDFFDTLVARLCPEPVALFVEVGRRLVDLGLLKMPVTDEEFQNLRITAEKNARELAFITKSKIEISLTEIYTCLQHVVTDPDQAAAIELQIEKESCYLNPCTTQLLKYIRSRGLRIAVLSDTYYSTDALHSILQFNGFDTNEIDLLLTSCDVGAIKVNGGLFQVAVSQLGIQPNEMIHLGDNWKSDYQAALQVGIKAFHYYRTTPYIDEVLQRERRIVETWSAFSSGLDSLRVLVQRLDCHIGKDKAYYRYGAFLLGPMMARFADWCVQQFREAGVTRVLAMMREGEFIGKMLERAAAAQGIHLEIVPFYTSRQATNLASIGEATQLNLLPRIARRSPLTVGEILESFGIQHSDLSELLTQAELEEQLNSPEVVRKLLSILTQGEPKKTIEASSAAARALVMAYLESLVEDHRQIGIVDLGWSCTIQRNLLNILHYAGSPLRILGCYLATAQNACNVVLNGGQVRAYLGNLGARGVLNESLMRYPEILEQTISACIGSSEGYCLNSNGEVEPILGLLYASEEECERKHLVQQGILAFQEVWLSVVSAKEQTSALSKFCVFPKMLEEVDRYNQAIVHRLISFPTRQEAQHFGKFHHDDNFGSDSWKLICNDNSLQALRVDGTIGLYHNRSTYWPQGTMAMERPEIVRLLSTGWRDLLGLSRLGKRSCYAGELLPYSHNEKDILEELIGEYKPGLVMIFGQGNSTVRRWLLDTLSALPASDLQVKRVAIEAVRYIVSLGDRITVPQVEHRLLFGNFTSEVFLSKVENEIFQLPQLKPVFLYLDHTCAGEEVESVLNRLASCLDLNDLIIVGHGGNDISELRESESAYMMTQKWFQESGQTQSFFQVQNPLWTADLFTIYMKDRLEDIETTLLALNLRDTNLIVFPNWSLSEEILVEELQQLIKTVATHPDKNHITLLIDTSGIAEEDAAIMLSDATVNLLMEEDLQVNEEPELSLLGQLSEIQWEALLSRLSARIVLENENQQAIAQARANSIPSCQLDHFGEQLLFQGLRT